MIIKIRKELFGYVLFRAVDRKYFIVDCDKECVNPAALVRDRFGADVADADIVMVPSAMVPGGPELSAPIGMYLEISERCNLNCGHCYKPKPIVAREMTLDERLKLVRELADMGVFEIRLCGNEPTLSDHFAAVAGYIKELGLFLGVNTNGVLSAKKRDELIRLAPDLVVVSVDGSRASHSSIRGEGTYDAAILLLERLRDAGITTRINTVLSKRTLGDIPAIADLASEYGCGISFLPFRPVGKNDEFNRLNAIDSDEMRGCVEEIMRQREVYPHVTMLTYFDVLCEKASYHHPIDRFNDPCPARKNGFITYSGDYFPCDFLRFAGSTYYCGNVLDSDFSHIWTGSETLGKFQGLRHEKCLKCGHYMKSCYGGCISGSIASGKSTDDDLCFFQVE